MKNKKKSLSKLEGEDLERINGGKVANYHWGNDDKLRNSETGLEAPIGTRFDHKTGDAVTSGGRVYRG
jgi:hypothetical protein